MFDASQNLSAPANPNSGVPLPPKTFLSTTNAARSTHHLDTRPPSNHEPRAPGQRYHVQQHLWDRKSPGFYANRRGRLGIGQGRLRTTPGRPEDDDAFAPHPEHPRRPRPSPPATAHQRLALTQTLILGRQERMPRPAGSAKRQQGASNLRDTRHENGLVGPGKRIPRRKSQGQLDASSKSSLENGSAPPVPVVPPTTNGYYPPHADDTMTDYNRAAASRRASVDANSEFSSAESLPTTAAHAIPEENHRRIDVNDAKNTNVHRDPGPIDLALTVLQSCPLHDTIAILIILMQMSPFALATIYMLFTLLTFVPPVTTSSGLSIAEIFDGNQGTPSLATLIGMDAIMILIWLFLWAPLQQFILDLAQVVISLTLGGGGSSRQGTNGNIFLCIGIVGVSQWSRRWSSLSQLGSLLGSNRFMKTGSDSTLESTVRAFDRRGAPGWIRSCLAIHILTQGLVRYIREWYLRRERRDLLSQSQADPEAGKAAAFSGEGVSEAAIMAADSDAHLQTNAASVSTKKRRKQSAQVRIRQPLWAALASTKIVMVKEYELSHAASESAGSNATDIHNLGNAPFNTQPDQIWICYVGCDEVCFATSHFSDWEDDVPAADAPPGIDATKPFYVRVNNAIWQPTRILRMDSEEGHTDGKPCWAGDIYGLTPLSNYECEFVSTRTGQVIFSTSVRTVQAKRRDVETATKTPSNPRSHTRHDSPATTLRASIASAEAKLADEKARLKAVRKDNNRKVNAAKKEIEKLGSALQSAGGDDEKLRQKIAQNNIQEKRAEEAIEELDEELKGLEKMPEELVVRHRAGQATYEAAKQCFDAARSSYKSFQSSINKEIKALEDEQASLQAKQNKIATRIAKIEGEYERIMDANKRGLNEAERHRQDRLALEADLQRNEQIFADKIQQLQSINAAKQMQVHELTSRMHQYLLSFDEAPLEQPVPSANQFQPAPWAPANQFQSQPSSMWPPSTSMSPQAASIAPMPHMAPFPPPLQTAFGVAPQSKTRGRSSSMLSSVSGLTQSTDDDERGNDGGFNPVIGPPSNVHGHHLGGRGPSGSTLRGPPGFNFVRHGSNGTSGSGSGSGSGLASGFVSGRSSVRSGSGSGGSLSNPASPV